MIYSDIGSDNPSLTGRRVKSRTDAYQYQHQGGGGGGGQTADGRFKDAIDDEGIEAAGAGAQASSSSAWR